MNPFFYQKIQRIADVTGASEILNNISDDVRIALVEDRGDTLTGITEAAAENFDASSHDGMVAYATALTVLRARVVATELESINTFISTVLTPLEPELAQKLKEAIFSIGTQAQSSN